MSDISVVGPFPTDFSPPTDCTAVSSVEVVGIDFAPTCLPSAFNTDRHAYYSPGTACPTGYTAQQRCRHTSGTATTITCCPVRPNIDVTMACVSDAEALSSVWVDLLCTWSAGNRETVILVTTVENGTTRVPAVTMRGGEGINAYGLKMIYEDADVSATTTAETTRETSAATSEVPEETSSSSSGISTGAKVAIGVVIPVVVIAVLLGVFFWYRRRKRYGAVNGASDSEHKHNPHAHGHVGELYGNQQAPPSELAVPTVVSELPGDGPMKGMYSPASGLSPSPAYSHTVVSSGDTNSPALSNVAPR